jgi:hypothetical protein
MKAGQMFVKTWIFRNTGETAWPENVTFVQTAGDDMGSSTYYL